MHRGCAHGADGIAASASTISSAFPVILAGMTPTSHGCNDVDISQPGSSSFEDHRLADAFHFADDMLILDVLRVFLDVCHCNDVDRNLGRVPSKIIVEDPLEVPRTLVNKVAGWRNLPNTFYLVLLLLYMAHEQTRPVVCAALCSILPPMAVLSGTCHGQIWDLGQLLMVASSSVPMELELLLSV